MTGLCVNYLRRSTRSFEDVQEDMLAQVRAALVGHAYVLKLTGADDAATLALLDKLPAEPEQGEIAPNATLAERARWHGEHEHVEQVIVCMEQMAASAAPGLPGSVRTEDAAPGVLLQARAAEGMIRPAFECLFGVKPDAGRKAVAWRPHTPIGWEGWKLENLRIGDASFDLTSERVSPSRARYTIRTAQQGWTVCVTENGEEKALPLEDWHDYYARYYGHDFYYWGRPEGSVPYTPTEVTTPDILRVYGEALCKYPDVILKDRIDGCDILWDVAEPEDSFNAKSFCLVYDRDWMAQYVDMADYYDADDGVLRDYRQNFFTKAYLRLTGTPRNSVVDILLWRTGAYLIAFWVLLLFWRKNGMQRFRSAAVPFLGNLIISVLYVYHQSFRYVYFVQVCVLALLFATVVCRPRPPQPEEE